MIAEAKERGDGRWGVEIHHGVQFFWLDYYVVKREEAEWMAEMFMIALHKHDIEKAGWVRQT